VVARVASTAGALFALASLLIEAMAARILGLLISRCVIGVQLQVLQAELAEPGSRDANLVANFAM
jgi:hypothetical protein